MKKLSFIELVILAKTIYVDFEALSPDGENLDSSSEDRKAFNSNFDKLGLLLKVYQEIYDRCPLCL